MHTKRTINVLFAAFLVSATLAVPSFAAKPISGGGQQPVAKSVCIDAGHGGTETGTSNGGIVEKDLNLKVALRLGEVLSARGYSTHFTRTSDVDVSRWDRASICNATDASMLVSVHHNGSSDPSTDYSLGLYHSNSSMNLAKIVGSAAADEFGMGSTFRIERFANRMLMNSDMPSMISESYFLTNSQRLAQLQADYLGMVDREAQALARGIDAYVVDSLPAL